MIQLHTYSAPIGKRDPTTALEAMRRLAERFMLVEAGVLHITAAATDDRLHLEIRATGRNRGAISSKIRKLAVLLARSGGVGPQELRRDDVVVENLRRTRFVSTSAA